LAGVWAQANRLAKDSKFMSKVLPKVIPLGDQGALAYCQNEGAALRLAAAARQANPLWLVDLVQAYASVAIFFDLDRTHFRVVAAWVRKLVENRVVTGTFPSPQHRIPCCYEFALDVPRITERTGLVAEDIIRLHTGKEYTVYAIGFCPGFPYLGYLADRLAGVPRLPTPRLRIEPGTVGLTGKQTGIYTEPRPGGWNLIGRTPLLLVDVPDGYFPLRTGDRVRFERIDEAEFKRLQGQRLEVPVHDDATQA
jgi:inhibitor of KinA